MLFSLRKVFLALVIFFLFLGGIFVFISTLTFFNNLNQEVLREKKTELSAFAEFVFTNEDTALTPQTRAAIADGLEVIASERGVRFVHLIDLETNSLVVSNQDAVASEVLEALPAYEEKTALDTTTQVGDLSVVNLTYAVDDRFVFWLSYERSLMAGPALLIAIQQTFLIATFLILFTIALYIVGQHFILKPLASIQRSLRAIGLGNLATRLPPGPPNELGALFDTFNQMATQLQAAKERDEQVSKMKSNFIATAAHQLRTPLTGASWAISALLGGEYGTLTQKQKKVMHDVEQRNKELVSIVSTLLNAASMESGESLYAYDVLQMEELVKEVLDDYKTRDDLTSNLKFTLRVAKAATGAKVCADRERLRWVLRNLFDNAVAYSPDGGTVSVKIDADENEVVVAVTDQGIGMPEEEQQHVFERFYRGSNAIRIKSTGNGLGLAIVKAVVEDHGGEIAFESKVGVGTTVRFTIPRFVG